MSMISNILALALMTIIITAVATTTARATDKILKKIGNIIRRGKNNAK